MCILIRKRWKVKVEVILRISWKRKGEDELQLYPYTTSALDGVGGQRPSPGCLTPAKRVGVTIQFIGSTYV